MLRPRHRDYAALAVAAVVTGILWLTGGLALFETLMTSVVFFAPAIGGLAAMAALTLARPRNPPQLPESNDERP